MNPNPYVGPRPFDREDHDLFFGRDVEADALLKLIAAHRGVLIYSPAGAGKTSLLNAQVIPSLIERGLVVLPLARMGALLPPGIDAAKVGNGFVFNALLSLLGEQANPHLLFNQTLKDGLCLLLETAPGAEPAEKGQAGRNGGIKSKPPRARRSAPKGPTQVLIFDRCEELFTAPSEKADLAQVRGFFNQLRDALEVNPRLGVIFSLNETCLGSLDPYLEALIDQPQAWARFRLGPLSAAGALAAVTQPALVAGVPFGPGQAGRLVEELQRASGLTAVPVVEPDLLDDPPGDAASAEAAPETAAEDVPETAAPADSALAPAVEPLLLQVVCSQLWANLPDDAHSVLTHDLPRSARRESLPQALTDYYETAVRAASAMGGVSEGEVRRWFSQQMITPQGTRGMAFQDLLETGGLSNLAVLEMEDLHLLVSHRWAGLHCYELAHECFIEPIRAANQAWALASETPLRVTARQWKATGEHGLLYSGGALKNARAWAEAASLTAPGEVEPYEWEFIQAGEKVQHASHTLRGWIIAGIISMVLLSVFLGLLTNSSRQRANLARQSQLEMQKARATAVMNAQEASQQRATALLAEEAAQRARDDAQRQALLASAREDAALSSQALDQNLPQTGLLLALQSIRASQKGGELRSVAGEQALRDGLGQVSGIPLQGHTLGINNLAASPDRRWLATVSDDGSLRLWDLQSPEPGKNSIALNPGQGWLSGVDFSPDSRWLAASGADASIHVWDMAPANTASTPAQAARQMQAQTAIVLKGHSASVEGLRFSPDGRWLISGSADKTVLLWDISKLPAIPQPVTLNDPTEGVVLLEVSADSRWLAAGGRNGMVWVWDLEAQDLTGSVRQMALLDRINSLTFSPDGRWLAAGGQDQRVVLWDMRLADPGALPLDLGHHQGAVSSLAFSPDGCWLASGGADRRILLWFMGVQGQGGQPGQVFYALTGHTEAVESLAFPKMIGPRENYQANRLVSGSTDHTLRVWDLSPVAVAGKDCRRPAGTNGQPLTMPDVRLTDFPSTVLRGLNGAVQKVDFVAGNRWLAAAGADGSARLWDLRALQPSQEPFQFDTTGTGHLYADAISSDGRWLAAAGQQGVFTWSLQDPQAAPRLVGCGKNGAYSLAAGANGLMAAGCLDGGVVVWSTSQLDNGSLFLPERLEGLQGVVYAVALSPDGQWLAAGDETGKLLTWRLQQGLPQGDPQTLMDDGGTVYSLLFDVHGRWLASGDAKGRVRLWNPAGNSLATFQASSAAAYSLSASPDGRWLAAGTWDRAGMVRLWDMNAFAGGKALTAGKEPPSFTLGGFINRVYALAFSPDGRWLAAGSADFTLRQWDLTRLAALDPAKTPQPDPQVYSSLLDDHHDLVFQAMYSPNSRWLLSASADATIRQWDTQDPRALPVVFNGHTAWVRMLAVTPDGRYVISASEDGTLRRWSLSLDDLMNAACQQVGRSLTPVEVNRYLNGAAVEPVCTANNP